MTYTHGHHESVLRSHRWRTIENSAAYLAGHLAETDSLLDIGCGPGTITADFALRVRAVTATEIHAEALGLARAECDRRGINNVSFVVADVHELDFPDDSFDVVHAHQVLQHVVDPVQAMREMRRVCKPGGLVAARDSDYAGFTWYPELPGLDRWLARYQELARANGGEPDAGRRLLAWAHGAGFREVTPTASIWCYATPEDRAWWADLWAERIKKSAMADQARAGGIPDEELDGIAEAWRTWGSDPDGWLAIPHGEILARG